jgi:hypothetical protein
MLNKLREKFFHKSAGIDGILVTVGLCIIALLVCVVMKEELVKLITKIVEEMQTKASSILKGTTTATIVFGRPWFW